MRTALALLLVPLVACVAACGDDAPESPVGPIAEVGRIHVADGFSFIPPAGWEQAQSPIGVPAIFMTGETRGEFRMNLNVNVNDLPQTGEVVDREFLDGLAGELVPEYAQVFTNYSLVEHGVVDVDQRLGLRMSSQFDQGTHQIANVQYMFPVGARLFVFTFTCRHADWEEMSPIFRASGRSILFD